MKKYLFAVFLICLTSTLFADAKKEIENFVKKDVNSKQFQRNNELIHSLQERGSKLSKQGKYNKAMECYQQALDKANELFGKGSTASALIYTSMGSLFLKQKEKLKAADLLVKASDIYKKSMGAMINPKAARLLLMQASFIYYDANSYQQAWKTLKKAEKDIAKFTPDEKRTYMPKIYRYLALAFFRDNKFERAIPYLKKSLSIESQKNPQNNMELGMINLFLGNALINIDKLEDALINLQETEKYFNSTDVDANYKYKLLFSLSIVNEQLSNKDQNLIYTKKLNKICQKFNSQDPRKIIGLICLADALNANNQENESVKLMKQALGLAKRQKQSTKSIMRIQRHLQEIIKDNNKTKN